MKSPDLARAAGAFLLVLLASASLRAEGDGGAADAGRSFFSTSRRFLVSGYPPAPGSELARWAEEVAGRMEELFGPLPHERGWYLELRPAPGGETLRSQGWVDGLLRQRLSLPRDLESDQEDALEGLSWLLLNRKLMALQPGPARARGLPSTPDWLAVGVAQHLYPELRQRNAALAMDRYRAGSILPLRALVEREFVAPGRWAEKADMGLLVAWMLERKAAWEVLWRAGAEGRRSGAQGFATQVLGFADEAEAERAWLEWVDARLKRRVATPVLDELQLAELEQLTRFQPGEWSGQTGGAGAPMTLADLIAERRAPWAIRSATQRALRIQMAMPGRSPEWQEVALLYLRFLEALSGRQPGYSGGLFGRGPSTRQLRRLLAGADEAFYALQRHARERDAYLSGVEARLHPESAGTAPAAPAGQEVTAYLDQVEARLQQELLRGGP